MAVCDLTVDVGSQPLNPDTHTDLLEMVYSNRVLEEEFQKAASLDFFRPVVDESWKNDLSVHSSIRIRFKEYQNPFETTQIDEVQYKDDQTCPPQLDIECTPGCVSTENQWRAEDCRFKNRFRIGVSWCAETERLLYQDAENRFQESLDNARTVFGTVGWSELICQAIANPADALIPFCIGDVPLTSHYYDASGQDQYTVMSAVVNYMQRVYGPRFSRDFAILAHPQFEYDILTDGSGLHNYINTGIETAWGNRDTFVAGGFRTMSAMPRLWGHQVMLAPDVVDYYPTTGALAGQNMNPWSSADGSKYYVVLVSNRAFFHGMTTLMDKKYFPATCDNKFDAIQQTWLSFYCLLFPNEVFVVAFDNPCVTSPGSPGSPTSP